MSIALRRPNRPARPVLRPPPAPPAVRPARRRRALSMIAASHYDPISLRSYPTLQARQLAALLLVSDDSSCDAAQPVSCHTCDEPKHGHALTEGGEGAPAAGAGTAAVAARAEAEAAEGAAEAEAAAGGEGGEGGEGAAAEAGATSAGRPRRFSAGAARRSIVHRVAHAMGGKARNDAR